MNIYNRLSHYWQQALINLQAAKLRSCLAVLGILVGTASVVALISCGQLATEKALSQFKTLGTDLLAISTYQQETKSGGSATYLPIETWRQFPDHIPQIVQIAPYNMAYQQMSFQGRPLNGVVIGADESLARIIHIKLVAGHFVSFVESFEHFCVIGAGIAKQIQETTLENPLGQQLRIGKSLYTIIGIAAPWKENAFFNDDVNQAVIIPIMGMALVNRDVQISNAILWLKPDSNIDAVIAKIKQIINEKAPELNLFTRSAKQVIASMESQAHIFTLLLGVIGAISLLVGGIGVMNVMLVSVSERKKEIGIRKAVGAKNSEIQALFLAESVILSLLGGIFGVILGLLFTRVVAWFSNWLFTMYLTPPLVGFAISVATGIFFGFYPARRAAMLEPIDSLRHA